MPRRAQVQATDTHPLFDVVADGEGVVSHVGAALLAGLARLADLLGLTAALGHRTNLGVRAGAHDRGRVLCDLAVLLADGGDYVSDLRALAAQPDLFGTVASVSTAWRVVAEEVATDPRGIPGIWSALARTRTERGHRVPTRPGRW
jgi:hypothetical protein